jgi:hypothetical protein
LRDAASPRPSGERGRGEGGFSPKAAYIFKKQLEEADAVVINRVDEISAAELKEVTDLVGAAYPGVPVVRMSALTGQGFDGLTELLDQKGNFGRRILDIDYDVYAEGEAELGWLNASVRIKAAALFELDALLLRIVGDLRQMFGKTNEEVAHLKAIGLHDGAFGVANLVSSATAPELSLPSRARVNEADLIVNARVAADPVVLEGQVRKIVKAVCQANQGAAEFVSVQSFRPGRPTPTHRYAAAK